MARFRAGTWVHIREKTTRLSASIRILGSANSPSSGTMLAPVISLEKHIVDGSDDAIVFADKDGCIRLWNAAAEHMLGYSADEALGQSLDLIIPEKHRPSHWEGYHRVMKTGETAYAGSLLMVPALRADGTRISVEFSVTLIHDETGGTEGIAAIMREVTERKASQRALQRELADLREHIGTSGEST